MAGNNATDTTEDGNRKDSILIMELEPFASWNAKTKGKLAQETRLRESLKNVREVLPKTKKRKNHTKTSTQ